MIYREDRGRCVGRHDQCQRPAVRGDLCLPCWRALPRCETCGHHADAHDEGPCAVNAHEEADGPECECHGFVG